MRITVKTRIVSPVALVWLAYTTPEDIKKWNSASDDWHTTSSFVELRVGGRFCSRMEAKDGSFGFNFEGVYTTIEVNRYIEYEFGSRVAQVVFTEDGSEVTEVEVTFDSDETHSIEQQMQGWQSILDNFKSYLESRSEGIVS